MDGAVEEFTCRRKTKLRSSEARITKIAEFILSKGVVVFERFCDCLQANGHPFFATSLRENEFSISQSIPSSVWKEVPEITRKLSDFEKELVEKVLRQKIQTLMLARSLSRRAMEERGNTLSDSKFQEMEHKMKRRADCEKHRANVDALNEQISMLKDQAHEQENRLLSQNQEMSSTIQKLNSNLQVASRFNMANDNTIRRTQECIEIYEDLLNTLHNELPPVSKMTPLLRETTDFEDVKVASSLKRQALDMKNRIRQLQKRLDEVGNQCWMLESNFDYLCDMFQVPHLDRKNPDLHELKRKVSLVVNDSKSRIVSLEADKHVLRNALETERRHFADLKDKVEAKVVETASIGVMHKPQQLDKGTNTTAPLLALPSRRASHVTASLPHLRPPPPAIDSPPSQPSPTAAAQAPEGGADFGLCVKALAKSPDNSLKLPPLASGYGGDPLGNAARVPYPIAIHTRSRTEAMLARKREREGQKKVTVKSFM